MDPILTTVGRAKHVHILGARSGAHFTRPARKVEAVRLLRAGTHVARPTKWGGLLLAPR